MGGHAFRLRDEDEDDLQWLLAHFGCDQGSESANLRCLIQKMVAVTRREEKMEPVSRGYSAFAKLATPKKPKVGTIPDEYITCSLRSRKAMKLSELPCLDLLFRCPNWKCHQEILAKLDPEPTLE